MVLETSYLPGTLNNPAGSFAFTCQLGFTTEWLVHLPHHHLLTSADSQEFTKEGTL